MSEADRYFIKKGFSKVIKQGIEEFTDDDGNYIHFDLVIERFTCNCYLSAKELQAINKKVEELRMDMSNKTSDKEVASLEDIKVIQHIISFYKDLDVIHSNDKCKEIAALEHILAEQKQDKARIKELEEELEKANRQLDLDYVEENFIPKQQVKGKLKELKIERDKIYKEFIESNRLDKQLHVQGIYLDAQIIILQELLEGEK